MTSPHTRIKIENCDFEFVCNKTWNELKVIANEVGIRYCTDCNKDVHLITTKHDIEIAKVLGVCVAVQFEVNIRQQRCPDEVENNLFKMRTLVGAIKFRPEEHETDIAPSKLKKHNHE